MALAYDQSYQEWKKSHPDSSIETAHKSVPMSPPKRFIFKKIEEAQEPKKAVKPANPKLDWRQWTPSNNLGYNSRNAARKALNKMAASRGEAWSNH